MPGFNGTGPRGMGPMTGGGRGVCSPGRGMRQDYGGYGTRGRGRGFSRWGQGFGYLESAPAVNGDDLTSLRQQAQDMREQLNELEARLQQVNAGAD